MKRCSACKITKSLSDFNKNSARRDGLQTHCRPCHNAHSRTYHNGEKKTHLRRIIKESRRIRTKIAQAAVIAYLSTHPCVDCGFSDIRALEFDHRRNKRFGVADALGDGYSLTTILEEIAKCDVRCRNCHQIITHERAKTYKSIFKVVRSVEPRREAAQQLRFRYESSNRPGSAGYQTALRTA